ncbi:hypothetical protein [Acinetobacter baumannii]|uniref:hypothetical protein n=1 Tax=Acinetobacter baumannii TaxID=470 RepID=UPI000BF5244F|nr:hypothetical protein [Acinetobacter baumannii]
MDKKALLEKFKAEVEASGTSLTHILKMCVFDEGSNDFKSEELHEYSVGCLNGAWWMFQRQQAKVGERQKRLNEYIFVAETLDEMYVKEVQKSENLQKRVEAFKDHAAMLRSAAKSYAYTEREQNILLSQADDIEKILGLEQRPNGEEQ